MLVINNNENKKKSFQTWQTFKIVSMLWYIVNIHTFEIDESFFYGYSKSVFCILVGKWVHVAGTYDSKTKQAKVFINGEIRNQSLGDGALSRDWGVRAGIGNKEKGRPLRGSIDEFRIYNYALKPDEIKALVSACKAAAPDTVSAAAEGGDNTGDTAQKSDDAPTPGGKCL